MGAKGGYSLKAADSHGRVHCGANPSVVHLRARPRVRSCNGPGIGGLWQSQSPPVPVFRGHHVGGGRGGGPRPPNPYNWRGEER